MPQPTYIPGQRWVSQTEAELGLGIITECEHRRVTISFPAVGERRTYATDNAPLGRVIYQEGDTVRDNDEQLWTVSQVTEQGGLYTYHCDPKGGDNGNPASTEIHEIELDCFVQFNAPEDRLFAGKIDSPKAYALRYQTIEHIRRLQQSPVLGLLGPRVQPLPHQMYIAHRVSRRFAPRVLLADEVGLGKTIEAGLIAHQQLMSGRCERILIVVPDTLLHQWLVEMLRRFNLNFTILDQERCLALEQSQPGNPFESAQLVLVSLSFLCTDSDRHQQAVEASWDLMIVDEAHHLEWSAPQNENQGPSQAYRVVETLAEKTKGLLLLTATPEQLGQESHFARLRLLDPDRFYDLQEFLHEDERYRPVNELVQALLDKPKDAPLSDELLSNLVYYLGEEVIHELKVLEQSDGVSVAQQRALDDLLDRHGTGRILFRNTRSNISGFPQRQLLTYPLAIDGERRTALLTKPVKTQIQPETEEADWLNTDPRVAWLLEWLKQHRRDKVLLICAQAASAIDLETYLRLYKGWRTAVFHEGLSLIERDRAAAYFADCEDGAQILICSEIGSEGRNFQFAHHLVMFDLPLHPDLLEQRIGRLDRIGQTETVKIHVPFFEDSAQADLLRWYHEGLDAFEDPCAAGAVLFQEFHRELFSQFAKPSAKGFEQLLEATSRALVQSKIIMREGRDPLLALNSCNPEQAEAIVAQINTDEQSQALQSYMENVFELFGVDNENQSEHSTLIQASSQMRSSHFPCLRDDPVTATYKRDFALSRDDVEFLTWEHPMVSGAMDMILNDNIGCATICTIKLPPIKPGTLLLEAIFLISCTAPKQMQLTRFLPTQPLRVVIDSQGRDLSHLLQTSHFDKLGENIPKSTALQIARRARDDITSLINCAKQEVEPKLKEVVGSAQHRAHEALTEELDRLKALMQINPNVRAEEIDHLSLNLEELEHHLSNAGVRLDALRVAVAT